MKIPYFDAHCDTIYRCEETGGTDAALEMDADRETQTAYYAACVCLRENGGHIDLVRGRAFARYGQFFALYWDAKNAPPDGMLAQCRRLHDRFLREIDENRDCITHCRSGAEVDEAVRQGKMAALLSIEGADLLDCEERNLELAHAWGVRLLNPVWNRANSLSGTNCEEPERGLSEKGKNFVRRMESLHIFPDVSHISDAGFWDVVKTAHGPVVASHSNARAICPHRRNLTDDQFRAIRDSGGVVGLNAFHGFVHAEPRQQTARTLALHAVHMAEVMGVEHVGCGFDFCEFMGPGNEGAEGLESAAHIRNLFYWLEKLGMNRQELEMVARGNFLRVLAGPDLPPQ